MRNVFSVLVLCVLLGAGCVSKSEPVTPAAETPSPFPEALEQPSENETEPAGTQTVPAVNHYDWDSDYRVSFDYPADKYIAEADETKLLISNTAIIPDSAISTSVTSITLRDGIKTDERIDEISAEAEVSQTSETIGQYTFIKVECVDGYTGRNQTVYLLDIFSRLFEYRAGTGEEDMAAGILESLSINLNY